MWVPRQGRGFHLFAGNTHGEPLAALGPAIFQDLAAASCRCTGPVTVVAGTTAIMRLIRTFHDCLWLPLPVFQTGVVFQFQWGSRKA